MKNIVNPVAVLIFTISFGLTYGLGKFYDHYRMLDQINTVFDADAPYYLGGFASGWMEPSFRHPFAGTAFGLPIRAVSKLTNKITGADELNTRRELALCVVPLFQGAKNAILYLLLVRIGVTTWQALILCCLNLFALSTVTVGSVPESFAISSMTIVLFAWLMTRDFNPSSRAPSWSWILSGGFAIGITITNVIPLTIFHLLGRRFGQAKTWRDSLRQSAIVSALSLILAFMIGAATSIAFSYKPANLLPYADKGGLGLWVQKQRPAEELMIAGVSTFAGVIQPEVAPNESLFGTSIDENNKPSILVMFTYAKRRLNNWVALSWALFFTGLLLVGAWRSYFHGLVWSTLIIGSVALLVFNFTLHMFFYLHDMFLYASHWQAPMIFSLAGLALTKSRNDLGPPVLVALTLASVVGSSIFIAKVIATMAN